jgi:hypothetical protein
MKRIVEINMTPSEFFEILLEGLKARSLIEPDVCTSDLAFLAREHNNSNPYQITINYEAVDYEKSKGLR